MRQEQREGRNKGIVAGVAALAMMFSAVVLFGYNAFQNNLGTVAAPIPVVARWSSMPVAWLMNASTPSNNVSNSTADCNNTLANCIQLSLAAGFSTWSNAKVPIGNTPATLTDVAASYSGNSSLSSPVYNDCQNVIGFSDTSSSDFSTGTIAFTEVSTATASSPTAFPFQYQCNGGAMKTCNYANCVADADIEFNPSEKFTTSLSPPAGTFSLQSVATHEEGHLLGLNHSGIGHSVMFPFGDSTFAGQQIQVSTDDAIGISFLYPSASFSTATGSISGTVNLSGTGVFGAHVVAVNAATGDAVTDGLTAPDGAYNLVGVPPGSYYILALPLAPDANSGILTMDNFSGWVCGYADSTCTTLPQNPTSYTARYH